MDPTPPENELVYTFEPDKASRRSLIVAVSVILAIALIAALVAHASTGHGAPAQGTSNASLAASTTIPRGLAPSSQYSDIVQFSWVSTPGDAKEPAPQALADRPPLVSCGVGTVAVKTQWPISDASYAVALLQVVCGTTDQHSYVGVLALGVYAACRCWIEREFMALPRSDSASSLPESQLWKLLAQSQATAQFSDDAASPPVDYAFWDDRSDYLLAGYADGSLPVPQGAQSLGTSAVCGASHCSWQSAWAIARGDVAAAAASNPGVGTIFVVTSTSEQVTIANLTGVLAHLDQIFTMVGGGFGGSGLGGPAQT
jgi:hypothetical protein